MNSFFTDTTISIFPNSRLSFKARYSITYDRVIRQRIPISVRGTNRHILNQAEPHLFTIRLQYMYSTHTSEIKIYGVHPLYSNPCRILTSITNARVKVPRAISKNVYAKRKAVERLFFSNIRLRKSGITVKFVKPISQNKHSEPIHPLLVISY